MPPQLPSARKMARKVKTPPPPRRAVQAPKQRATPRDDARNKKILYAIGASGFVMLAVVVGFFALSGGGDDGESAEGAVATIRAAGWTYQKTTSQGRTHVPEESVAQMQEFYNQDPRGLIMAPDDRLGDQIALTAWTHIAKGKTFDEEVFDTFVDEFGFRGPESCRNDIEQGCFRRENL